VGSGIWGIGLKRVTEYRQLRLYVERTFSRISRLIGRKSAVRESDHSVYVLVISLVPEHVDSSTSLEAGAHSVDFSGPASQ
jgi:hypothetical protein